MNQPNPTPLVEESGITTIKAVVRNGRIEVLDAVDLPDGTELSIPIPGPGLAR
jgi:hypothetical protein